MNNFYPHSNPLPADKLLRIGKILRNRRVELSLTQDDVAEDIGMARNSISNFENGNHEFNYELLEKVAGALDLDMLRLMIMVEVPDHYDDPIVLKAAQRIRARLEELKKRRLKHDE